MLVITPAACCRSPGRRPASKLFHQREVDIGIDILSLVINLVSDIKDYLMKNRIEPEQD